MEKEKLNYLDSVRKHWFLRSVVFSPEILDFIACQFALESNFGMSRLAKVENNHCGMHVPCRRLYYGLHSSIRNINKDEFASYATFDACILDYVSWLLYNRPSNSELLNLEDFKRFLRRSGYCSEKGYIDRINLIYQQLNPKNYGK